MGAHWARTLLRAIGWLLTPVVITTAAFLGAMVAAFFVPSFDVTHGLILTGIGGLLSASLAFWGWSRLLQHSRGLRQALHVAVDGTPMAETSIDQSIEERSLEANPAAHSPAEDSSR